jgi:hypothetical protein
MLLSGTSADPWTRQTLAVDVKSSINLKIPSKFREILKIGSRDRLKLRKVECIRYAAS